MATQSSPHAPSDVSVMLSYSRTDAVFAQKLCDDLKVAGFPTWLDTSSIPGGRLWRDEIDRAIDEAQVVLVVMSPAAMKSKWVRREYSYADRRGKVIIPLDYYPCNIPALLAERQTVSFRPGFVNTDAFYSRQFHQLIAALAGSTSLASSMPLSVARPASRITGWRRQVIGVLALLLLANVLLTALLAMLAGYSNGALLPMALQSYTPRLSLGGVALCALSLLGLLFLRARQPDGGVILYLDDRVRFLTKVYTRYTNRLKPPFAGALQLAIGLSEEAQAVAHPSLARQEGPAGQPHAFSAGTTIATAFEEAEEQLLILGASGAGKSWLLYQLALALTERARSDPKQRLPVPVVFNLASWALDRKRLDDWMVDQLAETWQAPLAIARVWVDRRKLFPLFDGLDEVRKDARDACVEAINRYQRDHGLEPLAVCCRKADYDALHARLDLHTAVVAQPLSEWQIDRYLAAGGAPLAELRTLAHDDTDVRSLLSTPLMLNVVALAYYGEGADTIPMLTHDKSAWTQAVFHDYVRRMLERRGAPQRERRRGHHTLEETTGFLAWLAMEMRVHEQLDAFFLERLQPSWLPDTQARFVWREQVQLVFGLFGGLSGGLGVGLVFGLLSGLSGGLGVGLAFGLLSGLFGGLIGVAVGLVVEMLNTARSKEISLMASLKFSRPSGYAQLWGLVAGVLFGLVVGLVGGLVSGLISGLIGGLLLGLLLGLGGGLFGMGPEMISGASIDEHDLDIPGRGASLSLRTGVFGGLVSGLLGGLLLGLVSGLVSELGSGLTSGLVVGLVVGLVFGLVFGLAFGLAFGLGAYIEYQLLVRALARLRLIPPHFIDFLDFAADHILLQRVGGGYRFVHALLLDYFADQWPALSATEPPKK